VWVLNKVNAAARPLGVLRLLSFQDGLKLPFQKRPVKKYVEFVGGSLTVDLNGYLQSLMQGANITLQRLGEIDAKWAELQQDMKEIPVCELMHGKDCIDILTVMLSGSEFRPEAVEPCFWISLELNALQSFKSLGAVVAYLGVQN
jgi:hypothetical protein